TARIYLPGEQCGLEAFGGQIAAGACRSTWTASGGGPNPSGVSFWSVHCLHGMPSLYGLVMGRTLVVRHIVGNEVDVAAVLSAQGAALALVQEDGLKHEVAVGDPATRGNLFLAPAVEQITGTRCSLEPWLDLRGFPLQEALGFLVACVMHNGKIESQSSIYVTRASFRLDRNWLDVRSITEQKTFDGPFQLVLTKSAREGYAHFDGKFA